MDDELKTIRTARNAISKFFTKSYPDMVKNPLLLLNYLHQHSYISRPTYTVIFEQRSPPCFIISCVVDEIRTRGTGSSKKAARTHSAQEMLSLIQNWGENISNTSVENCQSEPVESSLKNLFNQMQNMTQCEETHSFHRPAEYSSSFDLSDDMIVQPQCDLSETIPSQSFKRLFSCTKKGANDDSTNTSFESKMEIDTGKTIGEIMSLDDYFDPHFYMRSSSSKASSASSTNSDIENLIPGENYLQITNDDPAKVRTKASKTKSNNNRPKKEVKRTKFSSMPASYLLDSYFDPFFKLKPHFGNYVDKNTSPTNIEVIEVREEPEVNKSDKTSAPETEVQKVEKMKSPFAVLQERSIRNLKLIPRCSIDRHGEGFICKLVLDCFSSEGTGQSKKLAKINAAIKLLKLLEERS